MKASTLNRMKSYILFFYANFFILSVTETSRVDVTVFQPIEDLSANVTHGGFSSTRLDKLAYYPLGSLRSLGAGEKCSIKDEAKGVCNVLRLLSSCIRGREDLLEKYTPCWFTEKVSSCTNCCDNITLIKYSQGDDCKSTLEHLKDVFSSKLDYISEQFRTKPDQADFFLLQQVFKSAGNRSSVPILSPEVPHYGNEEFIETHLKSKEPLIVKKSPDRDDGNIRDFMQEFSKEKLMGAQYRRLGNALKHLSASDEFWGELNTLWNELLSKWESNSWVHWDDMWGEWEEGWKDWEEGWKDWEEEWEEWEENWEGILEEWEEKWEEKLEEWEDRWGEAWTEDLDNFYKKCSAFLGETLNMPNNNRNQGRGMSGFEENVCYGIWSSNTFSLPFYAETSLESTAPRATTSMGFDEGSYCQEYTIPYAVSANFYTSIFEILINKFISHYFFYVKQGKIEDAHTHVLNFQSSIACMAKIYGEAENFLTAVLGLREFLYNMNKTISSYIDNRPSTTPKAKSMVTWCGSVKLEHLIQEEVYLYFTLSDKFECPVVDNRYFNLYDELQVFNREIYDGSSVFSVIGSFRIAMEGCLIALDDILADFLNMESPHDVTSTTSSGMGITDIESSQNTTNGKYTTASATSTDKATDIATETTSILTVTTATAFSTDLGTTTTFVDDMIAIVTTACTTTAIISSSTVPHTTPYADYPTAEEEQPLEGVGGGPVGDIDWDEDDSLLVNIILVCVAVIAVIILCVLSFCVFRRICCFCKCCDTLSNRKASSSSHACHQEPQSTLAVVAPDYQSVVRGNFDEYNATAPAYGTMPYNSHLHNALTQGFQAVVPPQTYAYTQPQQDVQNSGGTILQPISPYMNNSYLPDFGFNQNAPQVVVPGYAMAPSNIYKANLNPSAPPP